MRPTPAELAEGLRAMLRSLGAELVSVEAKTALRRALYVLREARWNDAAFDLLRENEVLEQAIGRVRRFLDAPPHSPDTRLPADFAAALARNVALRRELAILLERLAGAELSSSAALRRDLVLLLRGPA